MPLLLDFFVGCFGRVVSIRPELIAKLLSYCIGVPGTFVRIFIGLWQSGPLRATKLPLLFSMVSVISCL